MRFTGFIGPSYRLASVTADCQRTINLFPEVNETGTGKEGEVATLRATPGLRTLLTLPASPYRGSYTASDGTLYAVGGNKFYRISSSWVATELGTLNTTEGRVSIADNGIHVVVVDGSYGYAWTIASSTFAQITDPDFPGANQVTYQDGYFIFNHPGTGQFLISGLNSVAFDALDFATAEGSPDTLTGLISDGERLYLFGTITTEIFYDSGNADFPFERIQGAMIKVGCDARFTIAELDGAIYWLGRTKDGRGTVYRSQSQQAQRVSTHAIEAVIAGLGDLSTASAWTYTEAGHSYYCLNLPGAESTWVFDASTNLWHERAYLNLGQYERHRAEGHSFAYNTHVVGDYANGKIYALENATRTDAGSPIARGRVAPHISKGSTLLRHNRFELDMETGVGIDGSGQGSDPVALLRWSNDKGRTWSNWKEASIGKIGETKKRVRWNRLGMARDRVYEVRITDPVAATLLGAEVDVEEGAS